MLIACITPFTACTSTAIIPISVLPEASVIVASGIVTVISSPCNVMAIVFPGLVKSPEAMLPATTWYNKIWVKGSSAGIAGKALKASFVGANTVKGPTPCNTSTKLVAGVNSVKAVTKVENVGSAAANVYCR